jgi:hypothetical protein
MTSIGNRQEQIRQTATQPKRELEVQRKIAARLTENNIRIQQGQFMTEQDLEEGRLRVLAYSLDL